MNREEKMVDAFFKATYVIESCVTNIHFENALSYIYNYKRYFEDENSYNFLLNKLNSEKNEKLR